MANPERDKARKKAHYEANKGECIARATERNKQHPEEHRKASLKYARANAAEMYEGLKRWREKNPDQSSRPREPVLPPPCRETQGPP